MAPCTRALNTPLHPDLQGIKAQRYTKQVLSHHLSFTDGEGEAPGEVSGFDTHSEHSEQGGEHPSHCPRSVTQLQVLPLCCPRQGAAPPARDAASGGGHCCPAPGCGWGTPANIRLLPPHAGGRTVVTLAGEQQEPGRLEPSQWNPLSPADARGAPGTPGAGPASRLPAEHFRQGGTLLTKGQGGSPFSPRASALLRPTRDGVWGLRRPLHP